MLEQLISYLAKTYDFDQDQKEYWEKIFTDLLPRIKKLKSSDFYTLKKMYTKEEWFSIQDPHTFGTYVFDLVDKGLLPLIHHEKNGANSHQYYKR